MNRVSTYKDYAGLNIAIDGVKLIDIVASSTGNDLELQCAFNIMWGEPDWVTREIWRRLLNEEETIVPLLTCPDDMDLYCSTIFMKVEHLQKTVKWSSFGWRGDNQKDFPEELDLFKEDYNFEFDKEEYSAFLNQFKPKEKLPKIYCLSGLGVDHRAFSNFNPTQCELIHVPWIPIHKGEALEDYAKRLFETMNVEGEYYLLGLSFGGMLAQEMTKFKKPKQLFLVSTANSISQINPLLVFVSKLGLHKILPSVFFQWSNVLTEWVFGAKSKNSKTVLKEILKDTDPVFVRRAISAIMNWKGSDKSPAKRIHGNKDKLIPKCKKPDFCVKNGGHLMILEKGVEIAKFVDDVFINKR